MSAFKDIVKKGWHPEKEGTTLKSQVSSLVGRNKQDSSSTDRAQHSSRPLSSLKDPSSFAPPPRRTAAPPPPSFTGPRNVVPAPSKYSDPHVSASSSWSEPSGSQTAAPPSLPPRLPPRTHSGTSTSSASARLGAAGVSVPLLGIGRASSPSKTSTPPPRSAASPAPPPPTQGTTWAQKQAAIKTASSWHKDPSSVSLADAKTAATTANNFRQRHGDQIAAGVAKAQGINQKYAISNRLGALAGNQNPAAQPTATDATSSPSAAGSALAAKKKPPPPPPKKSSLTASSALPQADDQPPEIPMATRPKF
ncbi:hypothetical protein CDD82_240 [Ophiocordyceps australis]|uniref:Uncharacterized protein n=1 Tax=Ophiocordyceps australis TaxID=1399860 RepID=A0A2C5YMK4_9HYPO|nr:hypothetical protein CDD82_240 [Ophiocordyceps australis]